VSVTILKILCCTPSRRTPLISTQFPSINVKKKTMYVLLSNHELQIPIVMSSIVKPRIANSNCHVEHCQTTNHKQKEPCPVDNIRRCGSPTETVQYASQITVDSRQVKIYPCTTHKTNHSTCQETQEIDSEYGSDDEHSTKQFNSQRQNNPPTHEAKFSQCMIHMFACIFVSHLQKRLIQHHRRVNFV